MPSIKRFSTSFIAQLKLYLYYYIVGCSLSMCYPCVYDIWMRWAVKTEMTKLVILSTLGRNFGQINTMLISGYLCRYTGTCTCTLHSKTTKLKYTLLQKKCTLIPSSSPCDLGSLTLTLGHVRFVKRS